MSLFKGFTRSTMWTKVIQSFILLIPSWNPSSPQPLAHHRRSVTPSGDSSTAPQHHRSLTVPWLIVAYVDHVENEQSTSPSMYTQMFPLTIQQHTFRHFVDLVTGHDVIDLHHDDSQLLRRRLRPMRCLKPHCSCHSPARHTLHHSPSLILCPLHGTGFLHYVLGTPSDPSPS